MKILVIGGGNMGLTYAQSFLRSHITEKENMMILEKSIEKAELLKKKDLCSIYSDPTDCMHRADIIILAVKPQDTPELFKTLKPHIDKEQVFLSIMAGVTIETLSQELGVEKVIRAMPNLPAQIGMGMTAFTSSNAVTRIELVMAQNLINTTGKTIYVDSEHAIDAATAISGSGPAYVFYFMRALIESAKKMGFSQSQSELLVAQTFRGAVNLYANNNLDAKEWISRVASRGGTTEAALASFISNKVHEDILAGAEAALERAKELGK